MAVGKRADLLIVPGDPIGDFPVLSQPALVMKNGQVCLHRISSGESQSFAGGQK